MYEFNYHRPTTLADASDVLASQDEATLLAGGMTLLPTMKQRLANPSDLVDLAGIPQLAEITVEPDIVRIGAMARHADVASSQAVQSAIPALARLAGKIGDVQVRNRGTIGGSVANSDPAADYPAAIVGLGASIVTNRRTIAAEDYFLGMFETALAAGEIITGFELPIPAQAAYEKFPNPASRYAVVGVFVARFGDAVRVGVTGAGPCAFRAQGFEVALAQEFRSSALDAVTIPHDAFNTDMHASAEYRGQLLRVLARRAVDSLAA